MSRHLRSGLAPQHGRPELTVLSTRTIDARCLAVHFDSMDGLQTWAALAEIFGTLTIVSGGAFGLLQFREFRKNRRYTVAADLCHQFSAPETARAFKLIRQLPDNVSAAELQEMGQEYEDAVMIVGMTLETMGLMVYQGIASFTTVNDLAGGMITLVWRKTGSFVAEMRELDDDPARGEWFQWLAERCAEFNRDSDPAYIAHAGWNKWGAK